MMVAWAIFVTVTCVMGMISYFLRWLNGDIVNFPIMVCAVIGMFWTIEKTWEWVL